MKRKDRNHGSAAGGGAPHANRMLPFAKIGEFGRRLPVSPKQQPGGRVTAAEIEQALTDTARVGAFLIDRAFPLSERERIARRFRATVAADMGRAWVPLVRSIGGPGLADWYAAGMPAGEMDRYMGANVADLGGEPNAEATFRDPEVSEVRREEMARDFIAGLAVCEGMPPKGSTEWCVRLMQFGGRGLLAWYDAGMPPGYLASFYRESDRREADGASAAAAAPAGEGEGAG
jgi:hypothetical protein